MMQEFHWIIFFLSYLILNLFLTFFVFLEERDIKVAQNYIFNPVFNKGGLHKSNRANFKWVKYQISNYRRVSCNFPYIYIFIYLLNLSL